ncbi:hypothetical protein TNCV_4064251 [Trichonephila clavipes]|nr:hypothetical protein TNCV_4064251 [Trichonephila clavipes]
MQDPIRHHLELQDRRDYTPAEMSSWVHGNKLLLSGGLVQLFSGTSTWPLPPDPTSPVRSVARSSAIITHRGQCCVIVKVKNHQSTTSFPQSWSATGLRGRKNSNKLNTKNQQSNIK